MPRRSSAAPQETPWPLLPWGLIALALVPLALCALLVWYRTGGAIVYGDVDWYAQGLRGLIQDGPLYDPSKLVAHPLERPPFWDQAPSTALLTLVLLLPQGGWVWGLIMTLSVVAGLMVIWPRVGAGGTVLLVPVMLLWLPITASLAWGNVNALAFLLLALAWRFQRQAGIAVGLAAALKLLPVIAVAWLIGRRDWKNAAWAIAIPTAATLVVVALKGPGVIADFLTLRMNQWVPPHPTHWGLTDVFGLPSLVGYGLAAALALLAIRFASFSLTIVAMLVASPALHITYWTWLLIPFFGVWVPAILEWRRGSGLPAGR